MLHVHATAGGLSRAVRDSLRAFATQVMGLSTYTQAYEQVSTPIWLYDSSRGCNVWGNR